MDAFRFILEKIAREVELTDDDFESQEAELAYRKAQLRIIGLWAREALEQDSGVLVE